jgi:hypothetical protein
MAEREVNIVKHNRREHMCARTDGHDAGSTVRSKSIMESRVPGQSAPDDWWQTAFPSLRACVVRAMPSHQRC